MIQHTCRRGDIAVRLLRSPFAAATFLALGLVGCATTAPAEEGEKAIVEADSWRHGYGEDEIQATLDAMGIPWKRSTGPTGDVLYLMEVRGTKILLEVLMPRPNPAAPLSRTYSNFRLTAAFAFPKQDGPDWSRMNEWNRTNRFCRAFLDMELDPVVQSDLVLEGGVSDLAFTRFLSRFAAVIDEFRRFIGFDDERMEMHRT